MTQFRRIHDQIFRLFISPIENSGPYRYSFVCWYSLRKEFEEKPYDPFENDPVAKYLRNRPEPSYVPPGMEPKPLRPRTPEEPLLKPPITTRSDRAISRELQMRWLKEETERAVKEGRAGPEMLRTVGPGPWDHDEAFWSSPYDSGVHLPRPLVTPWHLD